MAFFLLQVENRIKVSTQEVLNIERTTRQQSGSRTWFDERQWRLTASRFGEICKATERRDMDALCSSIFYPSKLSTPPIVHGKTYEKVALEKFAALYDTKITECGLYISVQMPYLAGSPDARIFYKNRRYLCEVKCPYTSRNEKIQPGK